MKFYCLLILGLLITRSSTANEIPPDSPLSLCLLKYKVGRSALDDLKPSGILAKVQVVVVSPEVIKQATGHDGGGIRKDPTANEYQIVIANNLTVEQMAHVLVHEIEHVKDEKDFDRFVKERPDLDALGPKVLQGLKGPNVDLFIKQNKESVDFVVLGFFCQELKAYEQNTKLHIEGLRFANEDAIRFRGLYVEKNYVEKIGAKMSYEEVQSAEKDCLAAKTFVDYMKSAAPRSGSSKTTLSGAQ